MYRWRAKIYLKNGSMIYGWWESKFNNRKDAVSELLIIPHEKINTSKSNRNFSSISGCDNNTHILFCVEDVSAIETSALAQL